MAREFSKKFYRSKEWKAVREYVFNRDFGVCTQCGRPGEEVHHTVWLNEENINDPSITLNADLLVTLCRDCHQRVHSKSSAVGDEYYFDEMGNLMPK